MRRLILASASPRRAELLRRLELEFEVRQAYHEAVPPGLSPVERAQEAAATKAALVASTITTTPMRANVAQPVVLGADTLIELDGRALGKPHDAEAATRMLTALSGRTHEVHTGIAVIELQTGRAECFVDSARVTFRALTAADIDAYVATGEPLDKAGAYAIQGGAASFVTEVEGDRTTVIGLPLDRVAHALRLFGLEPKLPPANT